MRLGLSLLCNNALKWFVLFTLEVLRTIIPRHQMVVTDLCKDTPLGET